MRFCFVTRLLFRLEDLEAPAYSLYIFNRWKAGLDIVFVMVVTAMVVSERG